MAKAGTYNTAKNNEMTIVLVHEKDWGKMPGKRTTIRDIAEALGISRGTVDRALNNRGGISEETKQQIILLFILNLPHRLEPIRNWL